MGAPVHFEIHPSSGTPIYRQLVDQVYALVAGGQLRPDDMLPSVRDVAQALAINPMTVSKAYSRLEAEGLLERVRGRGMRVARTRAEATVAERQRELATLLRPAFHRAAQLGLSEQQVRAVCERLLRELSP